MTVEHHSPPTSHKRRDESPEDMAPIDHHSVASLGNLWAGKIYEIQGVTAYHGRREEVVREMGNYMIGEDKFLFGAFNYIVREIFRLGPTASDMPSSGIEDCWVCNHIPRYLVN